MESICLGISVPSIFSMIIIMIMVFKSITSTLLVTLHVMYIAVCIHYELNIFFRLERKQ